MTTRGARLRIAEYGAEAVVLDLESGTLSRIGGAGVGICHALASGREASTVARELAERVGISPEQALRDVVAVWESVTAEHAPKEEVPLVSFRRNDGFEMLYLGQPVLRLSADGTAARWNAERELPADREAVLRLALPHLVTLQGHAVLHGAAVRRGSGVLVVSGETGAGKSTLGALLSGGAPISDDLVFLRVEAVQPTVPVEAEAPVRVGVAVDAEAPVRVTVLVDAEARARVWTREQAAHSLAATLPKAQVAEILGGPALPLADIWLLDPTNRGGDAIVREPLSPADALASTLLGMFGETHDPAVWERLFGLARTLAERVTVVRARVPGSIAALERAVNALGA